MEKINHNYSILTLFLALFFITACDKDEDFGEKHEDDSEYHHKPGLFIISEGNYSFGNGSLSFYDPPSRKVKNEIFYNANGRPLGDVPYQLAIYDDEIWITVNNSGKVEVLDLEDMSSKLTYLVGGSPRHIEKISDGSYFVSDLESSEMNIIDPESNMPVSSMEAEKSTEAMIYDGGYLFACNWSEFYVNKPNNTLSVIDPVGMSVVKTITVAKEPNSMVMDRNDHIWVLSSGGYDNSEYPALTLIDPVQRIVIRELKFQDKNISPSGLCISGQGDSLFFINKAIYAMSIADTALPQQPLIKASNRNINSLAVDPQSGELYFSNALDYQQKGWILRYNTYSKALTDSFRVGIIPGAMRFYRP